MMEFHSLPWSLNRASHPNVCALHEPADFLCLGLMPAQMLATQNEGVGLSGEPGGAAMPCSNKLWKEHSVTEKIQQKSVSSPEVLALGKYDWDDMPFVGFNELAQLSKRGEKWDKKAVRLDLLQPFRPLQANARSFNSVHLPHQGIFFMRGSKCCSTYEKCNSALYCEQAIWLVS